MSSFDSLLQQEAEYLRILVNKASRDGVLCCCSVTGILFYITSDCCFVA